MRLFILIPLLSTLSIGATGAPASSPGHAPSPADVIPTLDELGTEWLDPAGLVHMPSLHNFHEMAACSPSLLGVNYFPGGRLFAARTVTRWLEYDTLPMVELRINGDTPDAQQAKWFPHQAVRRAEVDGLEVQTTVRLAFEAPGILYRIVLTNPTPQPRNVEIEVAVPGGADATGAAISYESTDLPQRVAHRFAQLPERLVSTQNTVSGCWSLSLEPGESRTIELAMAHAPTRADDRESDPGPFLDALSRDFDAHWEQAEQRWARRWLQAFTPGNKHFSGHAPLLVTDDTTIRDIYYRSVLTLLALHRTDLAMSDRVFITSGERERGYVFYWDTSMWSKVFALIEPGAMKKQLRMFFRADPHGGFVYNMETGEQGPGWYAANDMTMFRLAHSYLAVTGDTAFLSEKVGDKTVLDHLEKLAVGWRELQRDKSVALADYGENENLLECAPKYVHRVPSFNAANVWMMRIVADYRERNGEPERAEELREWADEVAAAVLSLYKPGDGVWHALHRDGKRVELRHCYDFVCIGRFMARDLTPTMKREMVGFVQSELLTDRWMRAMSPRDEAAAISDRPDHGPLGAFGAWPALTASTMCTLGAWTEAVDFVRSTHPALREGVYGQALEYYGDRRHDHDAPIRIAARGWCLRECTGGGAFAEFVVDSLFGFAPDSREELRLAAPEQDRGFSGRLYGVRFHGRTIDIACDANGVRVLNQD